jgi:hypothetical protein
MGKKTHGSKHSRCLIFRKLVVPLGTIGRLKIKVKLPRAFKYFRAQMNDI